uniref:uncharacterized protein LOC125907197 n=1 Tax=Anopheles coluzzii TaxID=1518534 RepID=UPI0020FFE516|nr:uncharacterized protein LOC125907197 [Anopheles coluzzii]
MQQNLMFNASLVVLVFILSLLLNRQQVSTQIFHSPLGNQQFNHYPMKLPTHQLCDFVDMLHDEYGEYLVNIYNMPERGVCPIKPRSAHTIDKVFPTKAIPPFLPSGLWKIYIHTTLKEKEVSKSSPRSKDRLSGFVVQNMSE